MLAIRMQRTGRKGHAMFRMVVQESRLTPTSGKVVASIGSYDPHSKSLNLNKEKAEFYLSNGAQPSDRVARMLKKDGVKLPDWVKISDDKQRNVRNPDKRRSTAPAKPSEPVTEPDVPADPPIVATETKTVDDEAVTAATAEDEAAEADASDKTHELSDSADSEQTA